MCFVDCSSIVCPLWYWQSTIFSSCSSLGMLCIKFHPIQQNKPTQHTRCCCHHKTPHIWAPNSKSEPKMSALSITTYILILSMMVEGSTSRKPATITGAMKNYRYMYMYLFWDREILLQKYKRGKINFGLSWSRDLFPWLHDYHWHCSCLKLGWQKMCFVILWSWWWNWFNNCEQCALEWNIAMKSPAGRSSGHGFCRVLSRRPEASVATIISNWVRYSVGHICF